MLKKPLNKITISDITSDCGISRMTFYYHFRDIYDLLEWTCSEDAYKALEENSTYENWQQGFLQVFELLKENKLFITNVYNCVHQEQVVKYVKPLVDRLVLGIVNEEAEGMSVSEENRKFIARLYSYVFIGLALDWMKDDMQEEPQQIVGRLSILLKGSIRGALTRLTFGAF